MLLDLLLEVVEHTLDVLLHNTCIAELLRLRPASEGQCRLKRRHTVLETDTPSCLLDKL